MTTLQTLCINIMSSGMQVSTSASPAALASIKMDTEYAFDENVVMDVSAFLERSLAPIDDPLNNVVFKIKLNDRIDGSLITSIQGRLFTGGGIEALEQQYPTETSYILNKLDVNGALDTEYDFFDSVETSYKPASAAAIMSALKAAGALNESVSPYRVKSKVLSVPETPVTNMTADKVKTALQAMQPSVSYIGTCDIDNIAYIEAIAEAINRTGAGAIVDLGKITDWRVIVAIQNTLNIGDSALQLFWNPNVSRPPNATSLFSRKKWRPCVGDHIGQLLLRNARVNAKNLPPIHIPVAGHFFPIKFRDMEIMKGVELDDDAQEALAAARINVVLNEEFEGGSRWIYGDSLTQYDSRTSALRLANSAEITRYTKRLVISIVKKHLQKPMDSFIQDATSECERWLDACVSAGYLKEAAELGGKFYSLTIVNRDNGFEAADVELIRRPEGTARVVKLSDVVTR